MGGELLENDISEKVKYFVRFGLLGMLAVALICAGGVWLYYHGHASFQVRDAQVTSTMVGVKARANGKITEMLVNDGDHVEAGDVIAKVSVNVTEEQIQQLEQNLNLAKQNLEQIQQGQTITVPVPASNAGANAASQAALAQAAARMQRMNELYEMGAISAVKRDQAAAEYAEAQAAAAAASSSVSYQTMVQRSSPEMIKSAEVQVHQAEAALENAKKDSQATELIAPVSGTVYYTDLQENAEVKAGQTVVNIGDAGNIWVEARVAPHQLEKIRLGQFVSYQVDGKKLQGTVLEKETEAESANGTDNTENTDGGAPTASADGKKIVKVSLPTDMVAGIKPGMKAVVEFSEE